MLAIEKSLEDINKQGLEVLFEYPFGAHVKAHNPWKMVFFGYKCTPQ